MLRSPELELVQRVGRDSLRVHGDEGFGATKRQHFGPEVREDLDEHVARDSAVLVDAHFQTQESVDRKKRSVARHEECRALTGAVSKEGGVSTRLSYIER